MTFRLFLEGAGHNVVAASDGRRGLDLLNAEAFDLPILDIFMPGMDGLETLRLVRQKASLPIIAPPVRTTGRIPRHGRKLGAIRSLHKPFRPSVLLATVAACLEAVNRPSSQDKAGKISSGH